MEIIVFGDQTQDARRYLRAFLQTESDPVLTSFLNAAYLAIRAELLPPLRVKDERDWRFSSLFELLDISPSSRIQRIALDHALTTICHFALFLERGRQLHGSYPGLGCASNVGICVGTLAAAAIACTETTLELLPVAVQVCVLAFRVGEHAAEAGAQICHEASDASGTWALAVPYSKHEEVVRILDAFIQAKVSRLDNLVFSPLLTGALQALPSTNKPFITMISPQSVTICGPPHVLAELRQCEGFPGYASLPLLAPYHAPHLYNMSNLEALLNGSDTTDQSHGGRAILTQSNGKTMFNRNKKLRLALRQAMAKIFLEPVNFNEVVHDLKLHIESSQAHNASLVPVASNACSTIYHMLKTTTPTNITLADPVLPATASDHGGDAGTYSSPPKIAIVGMSGRFPGANNTSEFWDLLFNGLDVHKVVPPLRWNVESHVDISPEPAKNTSATPYGCWIEDPGLFDAKFFGMSPREARQVDPAQRLALMTAYEALEDGGIVPGTRSTQSHRVGVCYGSTSNDWMETNSAQEIDTFLIPGGNRAFIPGRINYFFKFSGPSLAIDTACSSSLAAIHTACNILWRGEADTMICGGTNIITNPDFTAGLDRGRFLSRTGNCRSFDDEADGYCRGEAVATVILKRLSDALLDHDPIKGVIVNACTNHSAEAESITRPCLDAQKYVFTKVLGGLDPANISYVEMHGTGTQVGDAVEMGSVLEVIAPSSGSGTRSSSPVHLGSVKANVGHGEAAAGATSLIKMLLMMQNNVIPPHVGIKTRINRKFPTDLLSRGVRIGKEPTVWVKPQSKPRHALLNNFSAAGGNTTLLLQDAPNDRVFSEADPRLAHPIAISGKSPSALRANAKAMLDFLHENPQLDVASLSYTTTARRVHHSHRILVRGSSLPDIVKAISVALENNTGLTRSITKSIVFAFTGQGSHYIGMGRELYQNIASFRKDIELFSLIAANQGFVSFIDLISQSHSSTETPSSQAVQLAMVCLQMALTRLWRSWGGIPDAVIGHSLGHYAALHAAGVISAADTIFLVGTRARIIETKCQTGTHSMLTLRASPEAIEHCLEATNVDVACINSTHETVLSGLKEEIELVSSRLAANRIPCRVLAVPFAFHSSQLDGVLAEFETAISGISFHAPRLPVLCPRSERVVTARDVFGPAHLVDHLRNRVNFAKVLKQAQAEQLVTGNTLFVEVGHNPTVTHMLRGTLGTDCKAFPTLSPKANAWTTLTDALGSLYVAGIAIRWDEYHREFADRLHVVSIPHYQWDLQHYWIQYTNDWSLRKGEPAQTQHRKQSMLSTTVHVVLEEQIRTDSGKIVLRSDLSSSELSPVVRGHKVNGLPLSTPSIYADIALTIARYLQEHLGQKLGGKLISIDNMCIEKALIAQPKGPQWLQTEVEISHGEVSQALCRFSSVDPDGTLIVSHASCVAVFGEHPRPNVLKDDGQVVTAKIEQLRRGISSGSSYRFNASMIYRMVATLADFDRGFRGLREIVLDSDAMAAASRIDLSSIPRRETEVYAAHPAYVDVLSQTAGFVMNANENSDPEVECFVNHGWKSFKLYEALKRNGSYESYVKMEKAEGSIWQGRLTVVCENRVVAIFEEIKLQGVPKRLLHQVLASANRLQARGSNAELDDHAPQHFHEELATRRIVPTERSGDDNLESALEKIAQIIASETGIDRSELYDETDFVSIGLDSLLALLITSRMRDDLGFDIGSTISIFDRYSTIGQLKTGYARYLGQDVETSNEPHDGLEILGQIPETDAPQIISKKQVTLNGGVSNVDFPPPMNMKAKEVRAVTSVVLQKGNAASRENGHTLFLFPDGSGSAASYAALPPVSSFISIVGLTCPYRQDPDAMTCSLEALIQSYVAEIRRRQKNPPYSVGGWSAGGILAYRAAQMLLDSGMAVRDIVLIDSPAPNDGLERLPARFYEHCSQVGLFGQIGGDVVPSGKGPNKWLVPHFNATIDLLSDYYAKPLHAPPGMAYPRPALCWVGRTALDDERYARFERQDDDGTGVRFLSEPRTDFSAGGWAKLMQAATSAGRDMHIEVLGQWDHFGIMYGPGAQALAGFLGRALNREG